jgi:hypothetical protein
VAESVQELVMPEAARLIADLPLIAQHLLCHQQKMMSLTLVVHLVLLVALSEVELPAIITTGEMLRMIWILQIGMAQLLAKSCCLLIGNQALLLL